MLVLSQKPNQKVFIGEGANRITITTIRIGPNSVRYGIDAPKDVKVVREEVLLRVEEPVAVGTEANDQ